jgi:hypothetical protein
MAAKSILSPRRRFFRRCRLYFRRFRIAVWLLILAIVGGLIYLNQVGLPDFAKRRLVEMLRERGLDLQFSRLRLRWYEGVVADNVRFGKVDDPFGPHLSLAEVQLQLNLRALSKLHAQIDGVVLRQGRLVWPVAGPEQSPRQLSIDNIQAKLRFLPGDLWAMDNFHAQFAGANIQLSGILTNASELRDWRFFQPDQTTPAGVWQNRLRGLADTLDNIHFTSPPELKLILQGDVHDLQSFTLRLGLSAPGAKTPWGNVSEGLFTARLLPATSGSLSHAYLALEAARTETSWGVATNLNATLSLALQPSNTNLIQADLALAVKQVCSLWGNTSNAVLTAQWTHAFANPTPISGQGDFRCDLLETTNRWKARKVRATVGFARAETNAESLNLGWKEEALLKQYAATWNSILEGIEVPNLVVDQVSCSGTWNAPELSITNFQARFDRTHLEGAAGLDIAARALHGHVSSDVDPNRFAPLLAEAGRQWLARIAWNSPPVLNAEATLTLPAWTNRQPDWVTDIQPTLTLQGEFGLPQGGAYRGVEIAAAHAHFSYSNQCWLLPDLVIDRPEGRITVEHRADDRTQQFYWHVHGTADVNIFRPALDVEARRGLDFFTFTQPPVVDAEIRGRLNHLESIHLQGHVELTNFTFRGESINGLQTDVEFTNLVLRLTQAHLQRGSGYMSTDGLTADFNARKVYLTNGFSTVEPQAIARAIGPITARTIMPYRFSQPPTGRVDGVIPMEGDEAADLHFDLIGGPFRWWKFNLPRIAGHIHWLGKTVSLSNVRADFYGGDATGFAHFDLSPEKGTDFQFSLNVSNAILQNLMADLSEQTNHLEGRLSGTLVITQANDAQPENLQGYGYVDLRDGLIWDIPLFGIFSPVLDSIVPGLGNSRASAATGSFMITNAILQSDDLDIDATTVRLLYRGTTDLEGRVNARVEAELLRDMWMIGPVVSKVLRPVTKMFEYKVTGTLADPKTEPVYLYILPKVLSFPFHPIRTIKDLIPGHFSWGRTKAPSPEMPAD